MIHPLSIRVLWCLPFLLSTVATTGSSISSNRNTDFIPCWDPCNGGDVNYELITTVRTFPILNGTFQGRTYDNPENPLSYMGPTLHVKPGQSVWIKLRNNLTRSDLGPKDVTVQDYWEMLRNPGEKIKYPFYKRPVANASLMKVDTPNMPGRFDHTNLHLHGLDVEVHMFDPVGTHNPEAPHIAIAPGDCYCYRFNIPQHHPGGMYWYHPHLHGSTATQMWSGMLGVLYVDGPLLDELVDYGVTNTHEFVIWDPVFKNVSHKETHYDLEVDEFLKGQTTLSKIHPFLINGQWDPEFTTKVGQVLHLRVLCATIENENTIIVYPKGREKEPWDDAALPFWIVATDGVTHARPRSTHILVVAGGQRHELLLQFDEPGTYVISQQGIQGMQFFDMWGHPHDQILAHITVHPTEDDTLRPTVPISEMTFTPGYPADESIQGTDIVKTETIVFSMGTNRDEAPFPQYFVNGKPFSPDRLDFRAEPNEAREYVLINANHNVHPFHIHVNRFQVKEMGSELSTDDYPVLKAVLDFDPDAWRDTVVVPPNGRARIWIQYKNYTGKTVLHCHFLAHEDTGMMSTLFIGPPDPVFHWRDHQSLVLGIAVGVLLATSCMVLASFLYNKPDRSGYNVVTMNEVKSKAMD